MAGALLAAAAIATMSGCGGKADASAGKNEPVPSASPTESWHSATLQDAARMFQEDFQGLATVDCSADCGPDLVKMFNDAHLLTELMKESGAPEGVYDEPLRLFGGLEKGFTTAAGLSGEARLPPMLGPARELNNWLKTNPVQ
ncbi:hypothetical protein AB0D13_35105 [Streptomyces sp. NPDC048430]|uniref:hypothetical protein n=1 Tax=Streptomyces sp. NPDC048430 TaxID=3155388 RepID=UPI003447A177